MPCATHWIVRLFFRCLCCTSMPCSILELMRLFSNYSNCVMCSQHILTLDRAKAQQLYGITCRIKEKVCQKGCLATNLVCVCVCVCVCMYVQCTVYSNHTCVYVLKYTDVTIEVWIPSKTFLPVLSFLHILWLFDINVYLRIKLSGLVKKHMHLLSIMIDSLVKQFHKFNLQPKEKNATLTIRAEGAKIKIRQFNFESTFNPLICKWNGLFKCTL